MSKVVIQGCESYDINTVETKKIDYTKCIECMCCHELCRYKAVELKKDNMIAGLMTKLCRGKYK